MVHRALNPDDREYFLPPITWPSGLEEPTRPPRLIHLDLSQWIRFGRVAQGKGIGEYAELLDVLRETVRSQRARVVISGAQYRELLKIKDPAQRRALAAVVEEVTDFSYLTSHLDIVRLELGASLDALTGTEGINWGSTSLLGSSALNVMGRVGGLRIMENGNDVTARLVANDPSWRTRLAELNRMAERMLLHGPSDEEAEDMRGDGYSPEQVEQGMIDNATLEAAWSKEIRKYLPGHLIRDLVMFRHLQLELLDLIVREQLVRHIQVDDIFTDPLGGARFVLGMPSSAVTVSMKAQYHQDPNRSWSVNDLYDIEALAITLPYCDIVFADASARDAAIRRGLDQHFQTLLPRRPEDLTELLSS